MFCLMFIYCVSGISSLKGAEESFKRQDLKKHFAKGEELEKIRASMKDLPMMRQAEREGDIINENIRHMTSSIGGKK